MFVGLAAVQAAHAAPSADTNDLAIEDLAMNLLASTNRNLGLAAELYEKDPKSSREVLDAIRATESTAKNVVLTLRVWRQSASKPETIRTPYSHLNSGLMSVLKEARALRRWVKDSDREALAEYREERIKALETLETLSSLSRRTVEAPPE
jgi:hypothetical protein